MNGKHSFNIEELRLSYPGEEDLSEETNLITSDSVTGSRNKLYITLDFIKSPGVTVCGFISFDNVDEKFIEFVANYCLFIGKRVIIESEFVIYMFPMVSIYNTFYDGPYLLRVTFIKI